MKPVQVKIEKIKKVQAPNTGQPILGGWEDDKEPAKETEERPAQEEEGRTVWCP